LILSGTKLSANICAPFAGDSTPQQFLDVETNRDSVFFNKNEQEAFRSCFKDPEKIKKIEKTAYKSFNKWRRIEAMLTLSYLDNKNAPAIFEISLQSKDDDIRYFSVIALGEMKSDSSARILVDLIRKDGFSRRKIVSVLESFPPEVTASYTIPLLKDNRPDVRFWALKLLSRLDPGKYLSVISMLVKDPSDEVRSAACECLGNTGKTGAAEALYSSLKDDSWVVRSAAVKALSNLLGNACLPKVTKLIKDNSLSVIYSVKEAMVAHIEAAIPYIERIMETDDKMAKIMCVEALEEAKRRPGK
ncbi:MAG: HEAT repeat domain-containing protein, partial [Candidatus Omnitrophica bacterium]|nr:HEAT repeat domain-containing protein [Candidatus Omnitrophota bacterium]